MSHASNPETPDSGPLPSDLVVTPRPTRFNPWLLPPLLAIVAALGVLLYRVRSPDWHWDSSSKPAKLAEAAPKPPEKPAEAKPKEPTVAKAETPSVPEPPSPAAVDSEPVPKPEPAPKVAQTQEEIEKEAARIRAEREELKKIKEKEGERLAKLPPKPRNEPTAEQLQALAQAEMKRMWDEMQSMMGRMPMARDFGPVPPLALGRGGFGLPPQVERQIREMERQQEEFLREAEARMRTQRGAFGPDFQLRMIPQNGNGNGNGNRRPNVRSFRFSSPDGRIQGFQMRFESNGDGPRKL